MFRDPVLCHIRASQIFSLGLLRVVILLIKSFKEQNFLIMMKLFYFFYDSYFLRPMKSLPNSGSQRVSRVSFEKF